MGQKQSWATSANHLVSSDGPMLPMPFLISEYTDFRAIRHDATHVGTMYRVAQNPLPPDWLLIPIGSGGWATSVEHLPHHPRQDELPALLQPAHHTTGAAQ